MKHYKVIKDTFKHGCIGEIVTIERNDVDGVPVVRLENGNTFYCPLDNLQDVTIAYHWRNVEVILAVIAAILLALCIYGAANNGSEWYVFAGLIVSLIGMVKLAVFLRNEKL